MVKKTLRIIGAVVLVLTAGLIVLYVVGRAELRAEAARNATDAQLYTIRKAADTYVIKRHETPPSLGVLVDGGFLPPDLLIDFWGEPLAFTRDGTRADVCSGGPDHVVGTADDLCLTLRFRH